MEKGLCYRGNNFLKCCYFLARGCDGYFSKNIPSVHYIHVQTHGDLNLISILYLGSIIIVLEMQA